MKQARLKLPGGELLLIQVHASYIYLRRTAPGQQYFIHEVYVPRSRAIPLLRWLLRSLRSVPPSKDHYPPKVARIHLAKQAELELDQKRQRKALYDAQHRRQKRQRYRAAKRRARRRRQSG